MNLRFWNRSDDDKRGESRASEAGGYEADVYELFRQALRPGMTVVDVGAHEGLFTCLAAAMVGPTGRVWAFEPAPGNYRVLKRRASAFSQVSTVQAAVSDRSGMALLSLDRGNSRQHSLFPGNTRRPWRTWPVRTVTLDRALPSHLPRLDILKIDAQGAEPQILRGARTCIKRLKPVVAFELWPEGWRQSGHTPLEVLESLKRLRYTVGCLSARRGFLPETCIEEFLERSTGRWQSINVLAVHAKSTAQLDWLRLKTR